MDNKHQTAEAPDHIMQFFSYSHLVALRKLLEAKDAAVRALLAVSVLFICVLLSGCAGANTHCTLDPLTGQVTCGVDIPPTAVVGTPVVAGGATKSIFRARGIDDCGDGSRAIDPAFQTIDRSIQITTFGRGVYPQALAARGLTSNVSVRQFGRYQKAMHEDLKREAHNAKVIRDYTDKRSMLSSFKGHVFGVHDCLDPLDPALQVSIPVIETVTNPPVTIIEPSAGTIPGVNADGSFSIEGTKKSVQSLEMRVTQLEHRVDSIDAGIARMTEASDKNFKALMDKIDGLKK